MRGKIIGAATALAALAGLPAPAQGVDFSVGIVGNIHVNGDLSACATLQWPGGLVVGAFTAVGAVQGPGTKYGTVRSAVPVLGSSGYWSACIPGAYYGATAGDGKYTLTASGATGDHVTVKQCTITFGSLSCV